MKKCLYFLNKKAFCTGSLVIKKYTFQEIDNFIKQLKQMHICIDNLPNEIKFYQNEILQILIIPTLDEESCCGSNCQPCVRESIIDNECKYNELVESLVSKLNKV